MKRTKFAADFLITKNKNNEETIVDTDGDDDAHNGVGTGNANGAGREARYGAGHPGKEVRATARPGE